MVSPDLRRTLLVFGVAAGLVQSSLAAQAKVELYRKNKSLDKNPARASRNVLCECSRSFCGQRLASVGL